MSEANLILTGILFVLLFSAAIILLISFLKKKMPGYLLKDNYSKEISVLFDALKESHFNNQSEYYEKIKKLAELFPDEPMFFLFAGDILRKSDPKKSLEIHRDILFRPSTDGKLRSIVLKHIAEDYIALKQNSKALSVLKDSVKSSNFPQARILISKVHESEGNFDEAYSEMEKYISSSKLKDNTLLKKLAARAVHHCFKSKTESNAAKWLEIIGKLSSDLEEIKAVEYSIFLVKGKIKKAASQLKILTDSGEFSEIFGRSLLLNNEKGSYINDQVEGKYSSVFKAFFNPGTEHQGLAEAVGINSVFYGKILSGKTKDSCCSDFLKASMHEDSFFICSECKTVIKTISPVCVHCQKITGRKFKLLS